MRICAEDIYGKSTTNKMNDSHNWIGIAVLLVALVSLVFFFNSETELSGAYIKGYDIQPAKTTIWGEYGITVAQECIRNVKENINKCCRFMDIPNSPTSCFEFCKTQSSPEECFDMCKDKCEDELAKILSIA